MALQVNVGGWDRKLRIVGGSALIVMAFMEVVGAWGYLGVLPVLTGTFRYCPPYSLLGINTCSMKP